MDNPRPAVVPYIGGMERKVSGNKPVKIATPQQVRGQRALYMQRLRKLSGGLVAALERVAMPKDIAGIDKMGKAMLTVARLVDVLHRDEPKEEDEMYGYDNAQPDAVDAWEHILERKLVGFAKDRKANGLATDLDFDPAELTRQLDLTGEYRADPPGR